MKRNKTAILLLKSLLFILLLSGCSKENETGFDDQFIADLKDYIQVEAKYKNIEENNINNLNNLYESQTYSMAHSSDGIKKALSQQQAYYEDAIDYSHNKIDFKPKTSSPEEKELYNAIIDFKEKKSSHDFPTIRLVDATYQIDRVNAKEEYEQSLQELNKSWNTIISLSEKYNLNLFGAEE
ncbi:MAG TPA: hypothetical protein DEB37_08530 [Lysinibacillus sp.]|jgi:hypothetical protein|uniref:Lipoprotein n=1 Tax=Lysinibacillus fusiformis TaxID=28031 RepID=A0A2I0UY37_9BACI|nr:MULTISPECIES: hypothetical protein [Lysinibacillus]HBT72296.1 hypothetical protein [Lysinibacillus sp.]KUF27597.1 hypothetical protein AK833_21560 [Lysinibacillus sp. F5]MEE3809655.1 hypothetical protein [Lysinibacillus fusiformis]PKU50984.1 hypothetical protein CRI88_15015 [Lysinibacillus fusiformis]WCH49440.1 hypothetical protein NV349_08685 [Lysinibacillus sp. OF-1]